MSSQDALWLTMDRPNNLMVIDSLMWFNAPLDLDRVREVLMARFVTKFPVFSCRPVHAGNHWEWQQDPDFDLDFHVREIALPGDAGFSELQAWVGSERSVPFDRNRPLWTFSVVTNFRPDPLTLGSAVMIRSHHSVADGVRLTQVMVSLCDVEGEPTDVGKALRNSTTPIDVAVSAATKLAASTVDVVSTSTRTAASLLVNPMKAMTAAAGVADHAGAILRNPARATDVVELVSSPDNRPVNDVASTAKLLLAAPSVETVWSGPPQPAKGASWAPMLSLAEVKRIRRATGTTVNDVLLGVVAGALSRYLAAHGEDTVDEVMWMVPVSVTPFDPDAGGHLGNHFALVAFRMPLGITDVHERLNEIHTRMDRIKASDEPLITFGVQTLISRLPAPAAASLTNYFANKARGVLTNVPGPTGPISFADVTVAGLLGWAPCSGDQAMTICIFSYNGQVSVGFGTDATLIPDPSLLTDFFYEEFEAMSAAFA